MVLYNRASRQAEPFISLYSWVSSSPSSAPPKMACFNQRREPATRDFANRSIGFSFPYGNPLQPNQGTMHVTAFKFQDRDGKTKNTEICGQEDLLLMIISESLFVDLTIIVKLDRWPFHDLALIAPRQKFLAHPFLLLRVLWACLLHVSCYPDGSQLMLS